MFLICTFGKNMILVTVLIKITENEKTT